MKIFKPISVFLFLAFCALLRQSAFCAPCFENEAQRKTYEQGACDEETQTRITRCIENNWAKNYLKDFEKDASSLRKAKQVPPAQEQLLNIFYSSTNPQDAFTAMSTIVAGSGGLTQEQQNRLLGILTSQTQDYKKILAVIMLANFGLIDSSYSDYLIPALNAQDEVLKSYASAAYSLLIPKMQEKRLDDIISLYGFDKTLALRAFIATGTNQNALFKHLKEAFLSPSTVRRLSAIEWSADLKNKKVLDALTEIPQQFNDASTLSAAAFALSKNYEVTQNAIEKTFKQAPSSTPATIGVMACAFTGNPCFAYVENCLKEGKANQKVNAARVISAVAGLLRENKEAYQNPAFEKQKLLQLIGPLGKAENANKDEAFTPYFEAASKELYQLLN